MVLRTPATHLFFILDTDSGQISDIDLGATSRYQTNLVLWVIFAGSKKVSYHFIIDLQKWYGELILQPITHKTISN